MRLLPLGVLTVGSMACGGGDSSSGADAGAMVDSPPALKRVFVTSSQYDGDLDAQCAPVGFGRLLGRAHTKLR